jgi:hypothetical protein
MQWVAGWKHVTQSLGEQLSEIQSWQLLLRM